MIKADMRARTSLEENDFFLQNSHLPATTGLHVKNQLKRENIGKLRYKGVSLAGIRSDYQLGDKFFAKFVFFLPFLSLSRRNYTVVARIVGSKSGDLGAH